MILIIDTSDSVNIIIALAKKGEVIAKKSLAAKHHQAEKLLPQIDQLLKSAKAKLKDIKGISVVSGPGSFTALRIGVVTANALGYGLKIPVVGFEKTEFKDLRQLAQKSMVKLSKAKGLSVVQPAYGSEPHITNPAKKRGNK